MALTPQEDRIRIGQLAFLHQGRHDTEVRGHAPENLDGAKQEADQVEQLDREHAGDGRERDGRGERYARDIAGDEESALVHSVDECPGWRAEEDVRDGLDHTKRRRRRWPP
jgi:hypothetical protein